MNYRGTLLCILWEMPSLGVVCWALVTLKATLVTTKRVRLTGTYRYESLGQELSTSRLLLSPAAAPCPPQLPGLSSRPEGLLGRSKTLPDLQLL